MPDSKQFRAEYEKHKQEGNIQREREKLQRPRPLYCLLVRGQMVYDSPLVWFFLVVNFVWAGCCFVGFTSAFDETSGAVRLLGLVGTVWTAALPFAVFHLREVAKAEEPLNVTGFFGMCFIVVPILDTVVFAGGYALWSWAVWGLKLLGVHSLFGWHF